MLTSFGGSTETSGGGRISLSFAPEVVFILVLKVLGRKRHHICCHLQDGHQDESEDEEKRSGSKRNKKTTTTTTTTHKAAEENISSHCWLAAYSSYDTCCSCSGQRGRAAQGCLQREIV